MGWGLRAFDFGAPDRNNVVAVLIRKFRVPVLHVFLQRKECPVAAWTDASTSALFQLGDIGLLRGFPVFGSFTKSIRDPNGVISLRQLLLEPVAFAAKLIFFAAALRIR